jgi:hypothetical protein
VTGHYTSRRPDWRDRLYSQLTTGGTMNIIRREPALVWSGLLSAAAALVVYFTSGLTQAQHASIVTIAVALGAVIVAIDTRPVQVPLLTGIIGTVLAALGAFGLHMDAHTQAVFLTGIGVALGLILRLHQTPVTPPVTPAPAAHAAG